jgi:tetratricopeptide (TPR) repeat protein
MYSPSSNFGKISSSIMGDRFMYLPLVAFCALVVIGAESLLRRTGLTLGFQGESPRPAWLRLLPLGAFGLLIVLYGFRTYDRNFDWHSDITLSQSEIKESPDSFRGYVTLARAYFELDRLGKIDEAIQLGEKGLAIVDSLPDLDNSPVTYVHQAMYYGAKGETLATRTNGRLIMNDSTRLWYEKAARVLERAEEIDLKAIAARRAQSDTRIPDAGYADIYLYLGKTYERLGMPQKEFEAYRYMQYVNPEDPRAYVSLAYGEAALGHDDDAVMSLTECVVLYPDWQEAWQPLVTIYSQTDRGQSHTLDLTAGSFPRWRADDPTVRQHLLKAHKNLIQLARATDRQEMAQRVRDSGINMYHFSAAELDETPTTTAPAPSPPSPVLYKLGSKLF